MLQVRHHLGASLHLCPSPVTHQWTLPISKQYPHRFTREFFICIDGTTISSFHKSVLRVGHAPVLLRAGAIGSVHRAAQVLEQSSLEGSEQRWVCFVSPPRKYVTPLPSCLY